MSDFIVLNQAEVIDPVSKGIVIVETLKDLESGGIFAIDGSLMEQEEDFYNPFDGKAETHLEIYNVVLADSHSMTVYSNSDRIEIAERIFKLFGQDSIISAA